MFQSLLAGLLLSLLVLPVTVGILLSLFAKLGIAGSIMMLVGIAALVALMSRHAPPANAAPD